MIVAVMIPRNVVLIFTVMCHIITYDSEKWVICQFHGSMNTIECIYTRPDGVGQSRKVDAMKRHTEHEMYEAATWNIVVNLFSSFVSRWNTL
jgi:hypothetical protein